MHSNDDQFSRRLQGGFDGNCCAKKLSGQHALHDAVAVDEAVR
jgi:hypothetical protein